MHTHGMAAVPCTVPQHVSRAGLFPGYRITFVSTYDVVVRAKPRALTSYITARTPGPREVGARVRYDAMGRPVRFRSDSAFWTASIYTPALFPFIRY